jgi:phosphatidylglycerophosphate synthase
MGEGLDATVHRLFPFLFWRPLNPNLLSVLGLLVSLGGAALWAQGAFRPGLILVFLGGFFDLVDGVVARHNGTSSVFGAFLDSTLDRVVDGALMLALVLYYAKEDQFVTAWVAGAALVAMQLVSYTKARAESVVPDFKGGILERAERIVILMFGALLGLMPLAVAIVAVGSVWTAGQRIAIARQRMAELPFEGPA